MATQKYNPQASDEAVIAIAATIASSESLRNTAENFNLSDRTLAKGDTVVLCAGLPVCKQGEISGETREWLAFPATIIRGKRKIATTISLNSLTRGYYAVKAEDVLSTSSKDTQYPSRTLLRRFGDVEIDSITTQNGQQVPFLSDDVSLKIVEVKGFRPLFDNGTWTVTDEETLFVVK